MEALEGLQALFLSFAPMTHGLGNYVCPRIHPSRGDWQVERLASGASHEQGNGEDAVAPGSHNGLPDISCEVDVTQD